jgi:hypothetical protein
MVHQMFIAMFTIYRHCSMYWARWIQSKNFQPISLKSILILSSYLRLGIPSGLFPSGLSTKILYAAHLPHARYMAGPSHPPQFDRPNNTWRRIRIMELLNMRFSPASCHFIRLRSKYSRQNPVLKQPQTVFFLQSEKPSRISGSHGGEYEDCCLLGCSTV